MRAAILAVSLLVIGLLAALWFREPAPVAPRTNLSSVDDDARPAVGEATEGDNGSPAPRTARESIPTEQPREAELVVLDPWSDRPVAGVPLEIAFEARVDRVVSDARGMVDTALAQPAAIVRSADATWIVCDAPVSLQQGRNELRAFRAIRFDGQVRDDRGAAIAGAGVSLVQVARSDAGNLALVPLRSTRTDEAGLYSLVLDRSAVGDVHLIAHAAPWLPSAEAIDPSVGSRAVDFDLGRGGSWRLRVVDGEKRPLAGVRVGVMTAVSPLHDELVVNDVPEGAGGDEGLVSRRVVTDEHGAATVPNWPAGVSPRVRVFWSKAYRYSITAIASGEQRHVPDEPATKFDVPSWNGRECVVHVTRSAKQVVQVSGRATGFTADELRDLQIGRFHESAGQWFAPEFAEDGSFRFDMPLWNSDDANDLPFTMRARLKGTPWRATVGEFRLAGDLRITDLQVAR